MATEFLSGVWPTMVTPFTSTGQVDFAALGRLIEWYIGKGVNGLFAVCQSSEMFHLSMEERVSIARFVKEKTANRVLVIASGHVSASFKDQVAELNAMRGTGIDGLVLVTNRLAGPDDSEEVWKENLQRLLETIDVDTNLGLYECPYPYKRLLSPGSLSWCAGLGRFNFLKDTSCDISAIREKIDAVQGSNLRIYNANTVTLLDSLKLGVAGYSGVMANFHPELYLWLMSNWRNRPVESYNLSSFLGLASLIETQSYPMCAKYHLVLEGVFENFECRTAASAELRSSVQLQVEQLRNLSKTISEWVPDCGNVL